MNINPIDVFYTNGNVSIVNVIQFLKPVNIEKIVLMINRFCDYDREFNDDLKEKFIEYCSALSIAEQKMVNQQFDLIREYNIYKHENHHADFCIDVNF